MELATQNQDAMISSAIVTPAGIQVARLSDQRLHIIHGPINLIVKANGQPSEVERAYDEALHRVDGLLQGLVDELEILRSPNTVSDVAATEPTAVRMLAARQRFGDRFVTPMAAVAGAVADEIVNAMKSVADLDKIFVNNGGDISVHLAPKQVLRIGIVSSLSDPSPSASLLLASNDGINGIATSGWDGHSMSLGIADAVTALASTAADADMAATLIANEINVDSPGIRRCAASTLDPDSDLVDQAVTIAVGQLDNDVIDTALEKGVKYAENLVTEGHIVGAMLFLQGHHRVVGRPTLIGQIDEQDS